MGVKLFVGCCEFFIVCCCCVVVEVVDVVEGDGGVV